MRLYKRLVDEQLYGTTRVPKNSTLNVDSGATLNNAGTWQLGGTTVNATASELNTSVSGLLATSAEINRAADVSTRVVNTTATTLTVTAAAHGSKLVTINSAAPIAVTLPAASGSGEVYTFIIGTAATATSHTIKVANTTDVMAGVSVLATTATNQVPGFATSATSDTISFNGTTTGGLKGDKVTIRDVASGLFQVDIIGQATGTVATPFSATV